MARAARKPKVTDARDGTEPEPISEAAVTRLEEKDYVASSTIARFHASGAFVRGIRGPVGGGKSTACCKEIMRRARAQVPDPNGIRKTKFCVVRNTYGELKDTTIRTWLDWFPEEIFGNFNYQQGSMSHHIQIGDIDCEVLFRALDRPQDVRKILSLELTGAWINEAREVPKSIIDAIGDRVGRYPSVRDGGCTWRGIIMDTNSPDTDHWWFHLAEEEIPKDWQFFAQPGAVTLKNGTWVANPDAENLLNLEKNYYITRVGGKSADYIKVYYANEYGFVQEGKVVYPEYSDAIHSSKVELTVIPTLPVYVGIGFGLEPCAIFAQRKPNGQWRWIDELTADAIGSERFADALASKIKADYSPSLEFRIFAHWLSPSDSEMQAEYQILRSRHIKPMPTRTDDATIRRDSVAHSLTRLIDREPGLLVSPKCKIARKGMSGGYQFGRVQVSGEERYHDKPMENRYKTICEAAQYMMIGGGEDRLVLKSQKPVKLKYPELGIV